MNAVIVLRSVSPAAPHRGPRRVRHRGGGLEGGLERHPPPPNLPPHPPTPGVSKARPNRTPPPPLLYPPLVCGDLIQFF